MDADVLHDLILAEFRKSIKVSIEEALHDVAVALAPKLSLKRERKPPSQKRQTKTSPELDKVLRILLGPEGR
jgi:hypothetical protein